MRYGKWPHEVAALPFHLFLAYREDWVSANTKSADEQKPSDEEVVEFNAETVTDRSAE